MSENLARWKKGKDRQERRPEPVQPPGEARAYQKLLQEAKAWGATLQNKGKGGLPSSLVLGVMRRDKFQCKRCGSRKEITIHHKGGIVASKWLSKQGHQNKVQNFATLCPSCHDAIHDQAREDGNDSSQVTAEGDKGDPRRDPEARK